MGDKQNAKLRRRENKEARERDKAERTGESPAQKAEAIRESNPPDLVAQARRMGTDGFLGGDTIER